MREKRKKKIYLTVDFLKFAFNKKTLSVVNITCTQPLIYIYIYILTINQIHHNQQLTLRENKLHIYKLAVCQTQYNHYQQTIHI